MIKSDVKSKLLAIFENTIESELKYDGSLRIIDYYSLFCKAAEKDKLHKMFGNLLCMFNYSYEDKDSIMMIFSLPINKEDSGAKSIAERVMEVVENIESCFVTIDYLKSQEVQEDKFIYVVAIKKL